MFACVWGNLAPAQACLREKQSWSKHCSHWPAPFVPKKVQARRPSFSKLNMAKSHYVPAWASQWVLTDFYLTSQFYGSTQVRMFRWKLPQFGENGHYCVNSCLWQVSWFQKTFLSHLLRVLLSANTYLDSGHFWPRSESLWERRHDNEYREPGLIANTE